MAVASLGRRSSLFFYFFFGVSRYVAAYIHGCRKPGYVRRCRLNIYGKSRGFAAEALRAYIRRVYAAQKLLLHLAVNRDFVSLAYGAAKCLFCEICAVFKISADAYAYHHRRARIPTGKLHRFKHKVHKIVL